MGAALRKAGFFIGKHLDEKGGIELKKDGMNWKLKIILRALPLVAMAAVLTIIGNFAVQRKNINKAAMEKVDDSRMIFRHAEEHDIMALSTALEVIVHDPEIREIYLEKDREKWRSVRHTAGLRDNWDDSKRHVVLGSTVEQGPVLECFTEENLEEVEREGVLFQRNKEDGKFFRCTGFAFNDARGAHAGSSLSLVDISAHVTRAESANRITFIFSVLLFTLLSFVFHLLSSIDFKGAGGGKK